MMSFAERIYPWGLTNVAVILVDRLLAEYNLHLYDQGGPTLFSFFQGLLLCAGLELVAAVCATMAGYRGTKWWFIVAALAGVLSLGCYFGEL